MITVERQPQGTCHGARGISRPWEDGVELIPREGDDRAVLGKAKLEALQHLTRRKIFRARLTASPITINKGEVAPEKLPVGQRDRRSRQARVDRMVRRIQEKRSEARFKKVEPLRASRADTNFFAAGGQPHRAMGSGQPADGCECGGDGKARAFNTGQGPARRSAEPRQKSPLMSSWI